MRPHLRAVIKFLRQAGAHNVRIEYGSKHPRCYYSWLNKETFYVLPNSPGDAYHGQRNAISDLRRRLGLGRHGGDQNEPLSEGKYDEIAQAGFLNMKGGD
jgi:hypothetical protein